MKLPGILGALLGLLAACAAPSPPRAPTAPPASAVAGVEAANLAVREAANGAAIYTRACAACHDGAVLQAPSKASLAALPAERILASLNTGIMQQQAAALSDDDRHAVAAYLSTSSPQPVHVASDKGLCAADDRGVLTPVRIADWGMDAGNQRRIDASATGISAANVAGLKLDWVFALPNGTRARVQPTLAGDTLFTADQTGAIFALNAATGCIRWSVQTPNEIRSALVIGTDARGAPDRLYFGDFAGGVHALDLATRKLLWSVKPEAHPQSTITGTLRLHAGRLYVPISSLEVVAAMNGKYACCTFRGAVAALDASTGALIWKTYTITEEPTQRGQNREGAAQFGPSGAPVWSSPTLDPARGLVYVGTGENYSHPASTMSDAILALSMATGKLEWRFQALSEDVWNAACSAGANCPLNTGPDYDFGAPPVLARLADGRELLLAGQKSGYVYALDPANGRLAWKAKPGRGGIMGGVHWGMASDARVLYVPISDLSAYPKDAHLPAQWGMHALDLATGKSLWSTVLENTCDKVAWRCAPSVSAAATLAPGVVFGGSLDGKVRAFSATDGAVLWVFDTNQDFEAVNGVKAFGGAIDSAGPVIGQNRVYVTSGYDKFGQKAGNLLLSFKVDD